MLAAGIARGGARMGMSKSNAAFDRIEFLSQPRDGKSRLTFAPNETIYSQGDPANAVFFLEKGIAKKSVTSVSGKDAVISIVAPGDFFGEGCLHPRLAHRFVSLTAITERLAVRIDKSAMMRGLREDPDLSELFINYLIDRNTRNIDDLVNQMLNSSEMRLARALLQLANFNETDKPKQAVGRMSQETLAEMVGTTRSRISFFMNKFRSLGLIEYTGNGQDLRINVPLLEKVLQESECPENITEAAPRARAAASQ